MRSFVIGRSTLTLITVSACSSHPSSAPSISGLPQGVVPLVRQTGQSPANWLLFQGNYLPGGFAVGFDKNIWFTDCASSSVDSMTMAGAVTIYPLPVSGCASAIIRGPHSDLWFLDGSYIGRITTTGVINMYQIPIPNESTNSLTV